MIILSLFLSIQCWSDNFPDPAVPVQIPPLGLWWVDANLTQSQFRREIEMQEAPVLSERTSSTDLSADLVYRYKRRLLLRVSFANLFNEKTTRSVTDAGTQLGLSASSGGRSGFREPSIGAIYPFIGLKAKWLLQGTYSPKMGSGGKTSSLRGGSNFSFKLTGQWKHEKIRPFSEFQYNLLGQQTIDDALRSSSSQLILKFGVYGYFDREISSSLTMSMINIGSYQEVSPTETVDYPQFNWRKVDLSVFYRISDQTSYYGGYAFSVFPDLDFGNFKVTGNSGSAIKIGVKYFP